MILIIENVKPIKYRKQVMKIEKPNKYGKRVNNPSIQTIKSRDGSGMVQFGSSWENHDQIENQWFFDNEIIWFQLKDGNQIRIGSNLVGFDPKTKLLKKKS